MWEFFVYEKKHFYAILLYRVYRTLNRFMTATTLLINNNLELNCKNY